MAYYDALKTKWPTLASKTTAAKLIEINALTVAGPSVDVPPAQVVRYLAINGKLAALLKYAAAPPATQAGLAAAQFAAVLQMGINAPLFYMSQPADNAANTGMLNALASDAATGITSADVTNLLALAATTIPWWQSVGYTSSISQNDLVAAGGLN